jgi:hypothetical protein
MKKIFSAFAVVAAFALFLSGPSANAQTATLSATDQARLTNALAQLDATLGIVRIRLAQNSLAADQRIALSGTLGSIRNTLSNLSFAMNAPANSNLARTPSTGAARAPMAVSQPQAQAQTDLNSQTTVPAPAETVAPAPIVNETPAAAEASSPSFLRSLLSSTFFWVALAVIALIALGTWAVRSVGAPRTAFASRREEDDDDRI